MYQLCEKRCLINSSVAAALCEILKASTWPSRCIPYLSTKGVFFLFFFYCIKNVLCLFTHPFYIYKVGGKKIYYFTLHISKKSPLSAISFSSINKPDSALSFAAWIYVEWFEGLKSASAVLFVLGVRCFPAVCFCCFSTTY